MKLDAFFQDFSTGSRTAEARPDGSMANPAESLDSDSSTFDAGYASGWNDAVKAAEERGERISAELERTVQDLGFSYHEALDQLRGQVLDALSEFLDALLPETRIDILRTHIEDALASRTDEEGGTEVVVAPDQVALFKALLGHHATGAVDLVADETLEVDQAYIRTERDNLLIDIHPLIAAFKDQIEALRMPPEEARHAG